MSYFAHLVILPTKKSVLFTGRKTWKEKCVFTCPRVRLFNINLPRNLNVCKKFITYLRDVFFIHVIN